MSFCGPHEGDGRDPQGQSSSREAATRNSIGRPCSPPTAARWSSGGEMGMGIPCSMDLTYHFRRGTATVDTSRPVPPMWREWLEPADSVGRSSRSSGRFRLHSCRPVPLDRKLDQPRDQVPVTDPRCLPEHRIHADRRESRNRIDLVEVDDSRSPVEQEVGARHPGQIERSEDPDGHGADRFAGLPRDHPPG